jgi:hypothetical protein
MNAGDVDQKRILVGSRAEEESPDGVKERLRGTSGQFGMVLVTVSILQTPYCLPYRYGYFIGTSRITGLEMDMEMEMEMEMGRFKEE